MLAEYERLEREILACFEGRECDFGPLALEIHRFQRTWNRPYANFCATQPEPRHWQEIPAVPQSAFKRFTLSVEPERATKIFHTSGTTGEGFGHHAMLNTRLYDGAIRAGWSRLQLPPRRHLILIPHPSDAPHSSLAHMMQTLEPLSPGTDWLLEAGGTFHSSLLLRLRQAIETDQPVALLGTALAFLHLFEQLGNDRLPLPRGSYAMETGGFKGSGREIAKAELYAQFRDFLDLDEGDVLNEYGMTELSSQFYTRGLDRPHTGPPWLRSVVFHPETGTEVGVGETGILRLFDLANLGSVIAIETQDLAIRREEGFELLGRDPAALPRGCSRSADELLQRRP